MPDLSDKVSGRKPISNEGLASIAKGEFPVEDQGLVSELATELLAYRTRLPASSMEGWRLTIRNRDETIAAQAVEIEAAKLFGGGYYDPTVTEGTRDYYRAEVARRALFAPLLLWCSSSAACGR